MTELGKFLRNLRMENEELLKEMAEKLLVTPSYLSAVEIGKRNMPEEWYQRIVDIYHLNIEEQKKFDLSIIKTKATLTIDIKDINDNYLQDRIIFARKVFEANKDTLIKIQKMLGDNDE